MAVSAAMTLVLALASAAAPERVLLCRAKVAGEPRLARAEALAEAGKSAGRFLDYGVVCEDAAEGARAARRVGLAHAVAATAEGSAESSRFVLVLADAETEAERARREVEVAPGRDAAGPLRGALDELLGTLPPPPGPRHPHLLPWVTVGVGVASLAVGTAFALSARSAAQAADGASTPADYTSARADWSSRRTASAVFLAVGALGVGGGLTWRYAF
ncbi:MAG TPA: hypothetical protein VF875_18565 [Anaeromyxobacter sp.]